MHLQTLKFYQEVEPTNANIELNIFNIMGSKNLDLLTNRRLVCLKV